MMSVRLTATGGQKLTRTTSLPSITSWSLMGWYQIETAASASVLLLFGTVSSNVYALEFLGNGTTLNIYNGNGNVSGSTLTVGTWYHLALTCAGASSGQYLGYVNGVLDTTSTTNAGVAITADQVTLGSLTTNDLTVNGDLAAVKFYGAVLTAAEIAQEMRQILPVRTTNLNSFYPLHTTNDELVDYSGAGLTLTSPGSRTTADGPPIPWDMGHHRRVYIPSAPGEGSALDLNLRLDEPVIGGSVFQ